MTTSIPQEPAKSTAPRATKKARVAKTSAHAAPPKAKAARKATRTRKPAPVRRGSKTAKILDLLKRTSGVTLKELMSVTGWQPHSVRGFLSGAVGKKMSMAVESFKSADGERAYRISSK